MHFLIPGAFEGLKIDSVYGEVQGSGALRTSASHTRAFTVRWDVIQTAQTHTDTHRVSIYLASSTCLSLEYSVISCQADEGYQESLLM